jgi:FeS assembly SUF system protein
MTEDHTAKPVEDPAAAASHDEPKADVPVVAGDATKDTIKKEPGFSIPDEELERLTADIIAALKTVFDPEIPADIYELGLIYNIDIDNDRLVTIEMTLTSPGCPVAGEMPAWVENAVSAVPGVNHCVVRLTFDPPWDQSRMSDEARLALNMF